MIDHVRKFALGLVLTSLGTVMANEASSNKSLKDLADLKINTEKNSLSTYFKSQYLSQDSKLNSVNRFQIQMGMKYSKNFLDSFYFDLNTAATFETGSSNSLFDNNQYEPNNDLSLKRAEFSWVPVEAFRLSGGALAMEDVKHELLVGHTTFLGMKEQLRYSNKNIKVELSAIQSIPRNRNLSNRLDKVEEGNPTFFMETLDVTVGSETNYINAAASQFAYDNLSNTIAGDSYYLGNSVNLMDDKDGEFVYSYIGNAYSAEAALTFKNFTVMPHAEYIINQAAPVNNQANLYGVKVKYSFGDNEVTFTSTLFDSDADASVSYYKNTLYRDNNRTGSILRLKFDNLTDKLHCGITYIRSEQKEAAQIEEKDSEQLVGIILRKDYDLF